MISNKRIKSVIRFRDLEILQKKIRKKGSSLNFEIIPSNYILSIKIFPEIL